MSVKLDHLERTVLELGTEIYRVKHRMDQVEKENSYYQEIFTSLRKALDEKGLISLEDFDEAIQLDRILQRQALNNADFMSSLIENDIKKAIN